MIKTPNCFNPSCSNSKILILCNLLLHIHNRWQLQSSRYILNLLALVKQSLLQYFLHNDLIQEYPLSPRVAVIWTSNLTTYVWIFCTYEQMFSYLTAFSKGAFGMHEHAWYFDHRAVIKAGISYISVASNSYAVHYHVTLLLCIFQ